MKTIVVTIKIDGLDQTGCDWDDEDEVHSFLHHLRRDILEACVQSTEIDRTSIKIDAVVANKVERFVCNTCGEMKSTKEGQECYPCSHPIDGEY